MRFLFKTRYEQDLGLFKDKIDAGWYLLLLAVLLVAPYVLPDYYLAQLVFILIYSIVGYGLMLLFGFTGQISMGHAASFAIGAYTEMYLQSKGMPFFVSAPVAIIFSAAAGLVIGVPALRLTGIYLAIGTMAFGFIIEEVMARWEHVTGGNSGKSVPSVNLFGEPNSSPEVFYYLCLVCCVAVALVIKNLLRSPSGRAMIAIRDSEVSAQSMGVHLAAYKTLSFSISAGITGLAGTLYAHQIRFISPEQFTLFQSIEFLMMLMIGGIGSLHGAVLGAIFIIVLPEVIGALKDVLPAAIGQQTGLKPTIFGLILIFFVLFEPLGLYGIWFKIRTYFSMFPLYRKNMFKRQKSYTKSERVH